MIIENLLILASGGFLSGILAGFLGIGGGFITVSILVSLGYTPVQAIATSTLVIVITSISGSLQNWRMGYFNYKRVIYLGLPALVTTQIGVYLASRIPPYLLLLLFGGFLVASIYLVDLRKRLSVKVENSKRPKFNPVVSRIVTGGTAGILTGLLGVGGGAVMVPLQMLLLGEQVKVAIQTSLGVIIASAVSASVGHASKGNILLIPGLLLGVGGLFGAQVSTRFLPKLPDSFVYLLFRSFLATMSVFLFWQAWKSYQGF